MGTTKGDMRMSKQFLNISKYNNAQYRDRSLSIVDEEEVSMDIGNMEIIDPIPFLNPDSDYKIVEKTEGGNQGFVVMQNDKPVAFARIAANMSQDTIFDPIHELAEADSGAFNILKSLGVTVPKTTVGQIKYFDETFTVFYSQSLGNRGYKNLCEECKSPHLQVSNSERFEELYEARKDSLDLLECVDPSNREALEESICHFFIANYFMGSRDLKAENMGIIDDKKLALIDADMVNVYKTLDVQNSDDSLVFKDRELHNYNTFSLKATVSRLSNFYPFLKEKYNQSEYSKQFLIGCLLTDENMTSQTFDGRTERQIGSIPLALLNTFLNVEKATFDKVYSQVYNRVLKLERSVEQNNNREQKVVDLTYKRAKKFNSFYINQKKYVEKQKCLCVQ